MPEPEPKSRNAVFAHAPSLVIAASTIVLIAVLAVYRVSIRPPLTLSEASAGVGQILKSQGPNFLNFSTGVLQARENDNPSDVRHRLLQKAGILSITSIPSAGSSVQLTSLGKSLIDQIPGVVIVKRDAHGGLSYFVPMAEMELLEVSSIRKTGTGRATVQFDWQWRPNRLGLIFDPSGDYAQTFTDKEWAELMDTYGARQYRQLPTKATVALLRTSEGWQLATD